jgi:hypothetical protein
MLTRDDLLQIREIVRDEVQSETRPIKKQLSVVTRKVNRLQKDITFIVHDYSNAILGIRKRVERIEGHLDLP